MTGSSGGSSLSDKLSLTGELTKVFSEASSLDSALQALVNLAHRMTRARSAAFFRPHGDSLVPIAYRSPSPNLGERYQILGLTEKVVEEAWSGVPHQESNQDDIRAFPGEKQAVAFAVGKHGVLYLGHQDERGLSSEALDLLPILVAQSNLGLRAISSREAEMKALKEIAETNEKLRLRESQLAQSSKMAAVGVLAAGLAHELNTPLGTVKLGLDYAVKNLASKPDSAERMLGTAKDGLSRAQIIVNKLLHYTRKDLRQTATFALAPEIQATLDSLHHQLETQGILVESNIQPGLEVQAGREEIRQVLGNLILNSCDAISGKDYSPTISITARTEAQRTIVDVTDLGPGVPADIVDRIFDPFFTTKALGEGTGLGLSISHQIVSHYQGQLELIPTDKGATFRLTLPTDSGDEFAG